MVKIEDDGIDGAKATIRPIFGFVLGEWQDIITEADRHRYYRLDECLTSR
jgi:hypothetical protein